MERRLFAAAGLLILTLMGGAPAARATNAYGVAGGLLITFQLENPSAVEGTVEITGLGAGQSVVGLDRRPADGQLYLITVDIANTGRIYRLASTGAATLIAILTQPLDGSFFAMDFNPVVDRIRLISDTRQNLRVNPVTGEVIVDVPVGYAAGDPGEGAFPALFACAYTNNFTGAGETALYGIDPGRDTLVRIDPPNAGLIHTVGALGVDAAGAAAFDFVPTPANHGYAALSVGGTTRLYRIELATGHAVELGTLGFGAVLDAFTIGTGYPHTTFSPSQVIRVVSNGVGYQELNFNYSTGQISVSPYQSTSGSVPRFFPPSEWTGVFHYDYGAGAFTQAVYSRQHLLPEVL